MKAVIVGAGGQLGRSLLMTVPPGAVVASFDRGALDICDRARVAAVVAAEAPDVVFNAAAYTAVDEAEREAAQAHAINTTAVRHLADAARDVTAHFVHVSTDFVFGGHSGVPYAPDAPTGPLGQYGRTKLAGEHAAGPEALIVRTAWLYAPTGHNFVRTMLRAMRERSQVRVVADQVGTPTYAIGLAHALWKLAARGARGIFHYTDSGVASWYDFAVAIQEEALAAGLLERAVPIVPIKTADYPTLAERPPYSVLDTQSTSAMLGDPAPHWRVQLRVMIEAIKADG
ncbi:dTDP-4-dehydrorhamnose reductase [Sphingomonas sp. NFR15]|uniref:dTDP-4-dehydrorhamnose reductase n=1 Tax=Sphingomonas sp. NFR15 TaxID=1566282 RepID=UPI00088AC972|nr:dTDP-4-dehydrorhamnose reductase [Sphingomonas sp. NFR15]SDA35500.1 dTDP-4-dehydrorhamnose reductase [Sphingomonas sp. NFR15]